VAWLSFALQTKLWCLHSGDNRSLLKENPMCQVVKERLLSICRLGSRLLRLGMRSSVVDRGDIDSNISWNRDRWGKKENWRGKDAYGYRWSGGHK